MNFFAARDALDAGDLAALDRLINSDVLRYKCFDGEFYGEGYFAGATLLHHVAGNPIRCPLPANIIEITRLLLDRGADAEARCGQSGESTVAGLLLTSRQASEAGVALPLLDMLKAAGAEVDLTGPDVLSDPLWNAAPGTAAALVARGAPMDLRHAAGLGRIDVLREQLASADPDLVEEALIYACVRGELDSARLLVDHGARGDQLGRRGPATALHEAANRGHVDIVALLLDHGADPTVHDRRWGGTALAWAEHGHLDKLPVMRALFARKG